MNKVFVLGADIGGSHITCAAIDVANAQPDMTTYTEVKVNSKAENANEILEAWAQAIVSTTQKLTNGTIKGLGLAIPGPFDYPNGIALYTGENDKFTSLYMCNVREQIAARTELKPEQIFFANDAACFGLGENWVGAGKGASHMVGITLGTGFGTVFMKDGKVITSGNEVPQGGELWNSPFRSTIAEDYASTRWFVKRYEELTGIKVSGVLDIAQAAAERPEVQQLFDEFATNLAEILAGPIQKFGAKKLIIGGNIAKASPLFLPKVQQAFDNQKLDVQVATSKLFEQAAVLGSAKLAIDSI